MKERQQAMSESTQDKIMTGVTSPNVTATQSIQAEQQARVFLGVFGLMIADLVKQVGELAMDCVLMHSTVGELDASAPEALTMKYMTYLVKGKERGRNVTNKVVFTDRYMGKQITKKQADDREWELYDMAGGKETDQYIFEVNPYKFARTSYTMAVDADRMVSRSMGTDKMQKDLAFQRMTDMRVMPFIDLEAVVSDFVIDEYSDGDPDRYKRKGGPQDELRQMAELGAEQGVVEQPSRGRPQLQDLNY